MDEGAITVEVRKRDEFALKLKMLRLEQGKTQEEIAKTIGISRGCLANYETGKRKPDSDMLKRIAEILGVSIDFLVNRSELRKVSISEEDFKVHARANEKLREYGDIINLNEVNVVSRIEIVDYFQYLKEKEAREKRM